MNNTDLIITIARRLDKFTLDELVVVSELSEEEIENILSDLLKKRIILQNGNTYFFNNKKQTTLNNQTLIEVKDSPQIIVIEEQDDYEEFLKFSKDTQDKIKRYVAVLNFVLQSGTKNIKNVVDLFNQTSGYKKVPCATVTRLLSNYKNYGFRGILPKYHNFSESPVPEELHTYFKKYYLTKEKLSANVALYKAQVALQNEQKIEQPYTHSSCTFLRKLKSEFTKEQIAYFRENIAPQKNKIIAVNIDEPLDMIFQKAAKIYLKRLKSENQLERLMHDKTSYKNHLKEYFDDLTVRDITTKIVAKYKQTMFDRGLSLNSVNVYISL